MKQMKLDRMSGSLRKAYREVFGTGQERTRAQEIVLDDLWKQCGMDRSNLMVGESGAVDPVLLGANEGMRLIYLRIFNEVTRGESPAEVAERMKEAPPIRRTA